MSAPPQVQHDAVLASEGLVSLIKAMVKFQASDLHLRIGRPPVFRINGKMVAAKSRDLTADEVDQLLKSVMSQRQFHDLELNRQVDLSFKVDAVGRFRLNAFFQRGTLAGAIRAIPSHVGSPKELGLPAIVQELARKNRGLLLITGSTGSGKSTSLSSLVQSLNETSAIHILTIEDPIEFVYRDLLATITQREVGSDASSFEVALRAGLRQDPNVIVLGELRDLETMKGALTAAETGHLVIATMHTQDSVGAIERIIDAFPGDAQNQVRLQLAGSLIGVVSQVLVETLDGRSRKLAVEVLVKSPAIQDSILRNEISRIPELIESSSDFYKMQSLNQALQKLLEKKEITLQEALKASRRPDDLKLRVSGMTRDQGY